MEPVAPRGGPRLTGPPWPPGGPASRPAGTGGRMGPPAAPSAPVKPDRMAAQQAGRRVRRARRARRRTPPETGHCGRRPWAALVGVAPRNRNRGQRRGPRGAGRGGASVRRIPYTAAVTAIRHPRTGCPCAGCCGVFCTRPCAKGQPGKVALGAAVRRRLTVLHTVSWDPVPWPTEQPWSNGDPCWTSNTVAGAPAVLPTGGCLHPPWGLVRPRQAPSPPRTGAADQGRHPPLRGPDGPRQGLSRHREPSACAEAVRDNPQPVATGMQQGRKIRCPCHT